MLKRVLLLTLVSILSSACQAQQHPGAEAFAEKAAAEHGLDAAAVTALLEDARFKQSIVDAMTRPAEGKDWYEYRPIFLTDKRIEGGVEFWRENADLIGQAAERFEVDPEVIVAIIGVETYYGRITGKDRVIDALATLAFDYPPRSKFFRNELMQFLILAREEEIDAMVPLGSYAGAMGRPQFMPSSFRAYAVDATGDGKRDIWNNWKDVAGSIANYFNAHGWRTGEEVTTQATIGSRWSGPFPKNILKAEDTVGSLSEMGVMFTTTKGSEAAAQLLTLEGADGDEHWVGFHNFFVITRYNRSPLYAMAVFELSEEIRAGFGE